MVFRKKGGIYPVKKNAFFALSQTGHFFKHIITYIIITFKNKENPRLNSEGFTRDKEQNPIKPFITFPHLVRIIL